MSKTDLNSQNLSSASDQQEDTKATSFEEASPPAPAADAEPALNAGDQDTVASTVPRQLEIGPAKPSTASRKVAITGKFSAKGATRAHDDRILLEESKLELDAVTMFLADRCIVKVEDQPPAIDYVDHDGVFHRHTFDFKLTLASGKRVAVIVKPSRRADRLDFKLQTSCIARDTPRDFADKVILLTEHEITERRVADAEFILAARRIVDPEADHAVDVIIPTLNGAIALGDFGTITGLAGRAIGAAVRAIDSGRLVVFKRMKPCWKTLTKTVGDGRIAAETLVCRA